MNLLLKLIKLLYSYCCYCWKSELHLLSLEQKLYSIRQRLTKIKIFWYYYYECDLTSISHSSITDCYSHIQVLPDELGSSENVEFLISQFTLYSHHQKPKLSYSNSAFRLPLNQQLISKI